MAMEIQNFSSETSASHPRVQSIKGFTKTFPPIYKNFLFETFMYTVVKLLRCINTLWLEGICYSYIVLCPIALITNRSEEIFVYPTAFA